MKLGLLTAQILNSCWRNCDSGARREIDRMSFASILDQLPAAQSPLLQRFAALIEPNDSAQFERMAQEARTAHPAKLWSHDADVRAALPEQRVRQQLPLLRLLARQPDPARHAHRRGGPGGGASISRRRDFGRSCSSLASTRNLSTKVISSIACARCARSFLRSRSNSDRWKRPGTSRWSKRAPKVWSSTRKPTTAVSTPRCTPPDRNGISTGGSIVPSGRTRPVFVASGSARCSVWRPGGRKRWRSRPISNTCSNVAGNRT